MSAAKFPSDVWDGLSPTSSRKIGDYEAPNPDDWDQIVAEVIAVQAAVKSGISASDTDIITNSVTTTADCTIGGDILLTGALKIGGVQVVGTQQAAITALGVTATTGSLPTPAGSQVISNAATPTAAELLKLCLELNAKIAALNSVLHTHGLTA